MSKFKGKVKESAKKDGKTSGGGSEYLAIPQGFKLYTMKEDQPISVLDFIPYEVTDKKHPERNPKAGIAVEGSQWWRRGYKLHRNIGAEKKSYVCLKSFGKACPICEAQEELWDVDKDAAIDLYPKDRFLYVVIPLESKDHDEIPHVFDMSFHTFQKQINKKLDIPKYEKYEDFMDLEEGATLEIEWNWKQLGKYLYPEAGSIMFEKRDPYDENILDEVPNLDECLVELSYDELRDIYLANAAGHDDEPRRSRRGRDDEDDDRSSRRSRRDDDEPRSSRRSSRDEINEVEPNSGEVKSGRSSRRDNDEPRRSRRDEPEEKEERTSRRSSRDPDPEPESTSRRSARHTREEEQEVERSSSRRAKSVEPEEKEESRSSRRSAPKEVEDDQPEQKEELRAERSGGGRRTRTEAPEEKKQEPQSSNSDYTWEELTEMGESKLRRLITAEKLKIKADDYDDDLNALRTEIAKQLGITIPKKK